MTKRNNLGKIINIVVSPIDDSSTEIYIATENKEYGYFRIGGNDTNDFTYKPLSIIDYIERTQHIIKNRCLLKTIKGFRKR